MASVGSVERDRRLRTRLSRERSVRVGNLVIDSLRKASAVPRLVLKGSLPIPRGYEPEASGPVGDSSFPISYSGGVAHAETHAPETNSALRAGNWALAQTVGVGEVAEVN